jgi:thioredoxin 1
LDTARRGHAGIEAPRRAVAASERAKHHSVVMATLKVDDSTFEREVLGASQPVLVDFWATWCGPCRAVAPILEELSEAFADVLTIAKLDVDAAPRTAERFRIQSIPTLVLFDGGKPIQAVQGALPKAQLAAFIERHVPGARSNLIGPRELAARIGRGDGVHLLDLRPEQHFARSHLRHARVVDPAHLDAEVAQLPATDTVVLVCRTGEQSKAAADRLHKAGAKNVLALNKGLLEWEGAGLPTYSTREEAELDARS